MQDLRMIFRYGKPYRRDCFAAVGLVFIECVFEMIIPMLMSTLVDEVCRAIIWRLSCGRAG